MLLVSYTLTLFNFGTCVILLQLKNITFALKDGVPYTVTWKSQVIDLSEYVGYA